VRVLITGGTGFIGSAIRRLLLARGDDVFVTCQDPAQAGDHGAARVLRYRIGIDAPQAVLEEAGARPDVIIHFAGPTHVWQAEDMGDLATRQIVGGTREWLAAARELASPSAPVRFVFGGSCHEYGESIQELGPCMSEDMPSRPDGVYARAKLEAESLALAANEAGLEVLGARAFNHVGIGQKPSYFVPSLVRRIREAREAGARRIESGDLGVMLLAEKGRPGLVYNVGSGRGTRLRDAVGVMLEVLGASDLGVEEQPGIGARRDLGDHFADLERITRDTGYVPERSFEDTVRSVQDAQLSR